MRAIQREERSTLLEVEELTKHFKDVKAVDGINLFIEQGEIVGLLGPNGAGKSTAISMIATLLPPTKGEILFRGKSVVDSPDSLRNVLGMVPQELALYLELSAWENLQFFGRLYGLKKNERDQRVLEILQLVGLEEKKHALVKTFSGGMKRRLNLALALLHQPSFVIMDEPTVGIDPQSRNHILETVRRLNREQNMTVLYTSHYMEEVEYLCDRIYIMDQGHIIASGTKEELKAILSSENTIEVKVDTVNHSFLEGLEQMSGLRSWSVEGKLITLIVPKEMHILGELFDLARAQEIGITSVDIKTPTLEDIFLHLTGRTLRD